MFLDIFILLLFLISGLIAFLRGFVREALSVVGLGLALLAAFTLGPALLPSVEGWLGVVPDEEVGKLFGIVPMDFVAMIVSRGGVFLVVLIILSVVTHFLAEFIKSMGLGAVDRSMGVVFGLLRAALVSVVLYLPIHMLVEQETKDDWFAKSKTHFYVESGANMLADSMPGDMFKKKIDEAQASLEGSDAIMSAREKLQAMDLLRADLTSAERTKLVTEKLKSGEIQKAFEGEGYSDDFRANIDSLIEENISSGLNE